ncbi:MAG: thioesterase family protein [Butyribacter sp.]|nr:thioesterase family protein [bacterium]MDY3854264.1 thioesterase family protein [Butyribacter sp.]
MKDSSVQYSRKINYYETDQMGIVHHSNYIRFFEEARLMLLDEKLMDYAKMEELGIIIPVTFVECKYLVPVHYGDEIVIDTCMTKFDGIKMEVSYRIYQKDSEVLCTTGKSGHCFLDAEMKPIRMKRRFPELYEKLKGLVENIE